MMNDAKKVSSFKTEPLLWFIIGAFTVWGVYLAVGSTGFFTPQAKLFDLRKFFIVSGCSLAFLLFWYSNISLRKFKSAQRANEDAGDASRVATSVASWVSLTASLVAYAVWLLAYGVSETRQVSVGCLAALFFGVSMVAALVGLSDPIKRSGKWAASVAFMLFAAAIILFVLQVRNFVELNAT